MIRIDVAIDVNNKGFGRVRQLIKLVKMLGRSIRQTIATVDSFIESNQSHYWKMFHHHNANRFWGRMSYHQTYLDRSEVQTRVLKILFDSDQVDIRQFCFTQDIRRELNLDSLSITVLISSIEEDFNTIFDEETYDKVKTLEEVVTILLQDKNIS